MVAAGPASHRTAPTCLLSCLPPCPNQQDPLQPTNVLRTLANIAALRWRPLPPHLSPACADLISRLLVRDPAARLALPDIAAHPWLAAHGVTVAPALVPAPQQPAVQAAAAAVASPTGDVLQLLVASGGAEAAEVPMAVDECGAGPAPHQSSFSFAADRKATPATPRVQLTATTVAPAVSPLVRGLGSAAAVPVVAAAAATAAPPAKRHGLFALFMCSRPCSH